MTVAAASAVAVTVLILGFLLVLVANTNHLTTQIRGQVTMVAYLKDNATAQQISALQQQLRSDSRVQEVHYVSKTQALQQMKEQLGSNSSLLAGMENRNPLPASLQIKPKQTEEVGALSQTLRENPAVEKVNDGGQVVPQITRVTNIVRGVGAVLVIALALTSAFLIANTIRLTIYARRHEIEIMRLVGATNGFIRWPFIIQGFLLGLCGAILPIVVLNVAYHYAAQRWGSSLVFSMVSPDALLGPLTIVLLLISIAVGVGGSLTGMRRSLRV